MAEARHPKQGRTARDAEREPVSPPRTEAPFGDILAVASGLGNAEFCRLINGGARGEAAPPGTDAGVASHPVDRMLARSMDGPARKRAGGGAILARFVGTEHRELGNTTRTAIDLGNGVVLTWGEVVALAGDEYASPEELLEDVKSDAGKARLRAALEHDGIPGAIAGTLPAPTPVQREAHEAKYIRLALTNITHFPDAGEAIGAWASHHAGAVELAVRAGLANAPAEMNMAYLNEAFGEHFLTDCFSGGHIRTPRRQIVEWYTQTFAPRVAQPLVDNLKAHLIEALVREASPQTLVPDVELRRRTENRVNPGIDAAIATAGGMTKLTEFIGLGLAGVISGTLHDKEGEDGVLVASDAHPVPWRAYGDKGLAKSPVSRDQADKAIAEAKAQVDGAYITGEEEGATRDEAAAENPPTRVHFGFASSTLTPEGADAVSTAAGYMAYRPDAIVAITGHTDPIGSDSDNEVLGKARADAVSSALATRGVDVSRVHASSMGEKALVSRNPRTYGRNRRADFAWATGMAPGGASGSQPSDRERATTRAMEKARAQADTALVLRYVPRPIEERAQASVAGGNAELPDWHWGRIDTAIRASADNWIRSMVGTKLEAQLDGVGQLDRVTETVPVTGTVITVHPRERAKEIVRALMASPTGQLGDLMGEAPGPP